MFRLSLYEISTFRVAPSGVVAISTLNVLDTILQILDIRCTIGVRLQGTVKCAHPSRVLLFPKACHVFLFLQFQLLVKFIYGFLLLSRHLRYSLPVRSWCRKVIFLIFNLFTRKANIQTRQHDHTFLSQSILHVWGSRRIIQLFVRLGEFCLESLSWSQWWIL